MSDARTFGLTDKAAKLLNVIRFYAEAGCTPPTYQEMADTLGLKSKSGIHRMIRQLVERGLVRNLPGRNQSVSLVDLTTIALPELEHALLSAAAKAHGRTPDEHNAALIRQHCSSSFSAQLADASRESFAKSNF